MTALKWYMTLHHSQTDDPRLSKKMEVEKQLPQAVQHKVQMLLQREDNPQEKHIFLYLPDLILYSFSALLYHIGLNPSFETEAAPWDNPEHLFIAADLKPFETTPDAIKSLLPVLEFESLVIKQGKSPLPAPECAVCLQFIEPRNHVRELENCCHAFQVACMDRWIDFDRFSCPLCRSAVVPTPAGQVDGENGPHRVLKVLLGAEGC